MITTPAAGPVITLAALAENVASPVVQFAMAALPEAMATAEGGIAYARQRHEEVWTPRPAAPATTSSPSSTRSTVTFGLVAE